MIKVSKSKDIDMLNGPLFKNIILYTLPIIATNILQLLFNAADLIVVGRMCGSNCVAAVGATSSLIHLLTNFFIGLSVGAGVITATAKGSKDDKAIADTVHTSIPLAIICGIFLTVLGVLFSNKFLMLMDTPKEILPLSSTYMKIYFLGICATLIYNFCAAILRALGDTRSPLIYLTLAGILNVIMNVIFIFFFDMDVDGVALATVLSQCVSAVLVLIALMKRTDSSKLYIKKIGIRKKAFFSIVKIGLPAGIQGSLFSISNVLIQSSINSFGAAMISGSSAASNLEGFVYVIMNSFHQTALNFTGQNVGTQNYKRINKIFKICIASVAVVGLVTGVSLRIFGRPLLSIYITDSNEAIEMGLIRLTYISLIYFLCGIMDVATGSIRGLGISLVPMIITILGVCAFRIFWIYTVFQIPSMHTPEGLFISYPISWVLTFVAELITFLTVCRRRKRSIHAISK